MHIPDGYLSPATCAAGIAVAAPMVAVACRSLSRRLGGHTAPKMALGVQALVFGDGGVLALGVNITNMAVIAPVVGYGVYRLAAGRAPTRWRRICAAAAGGYVGINAAALAAAIWLGIQPALFHTAAGAPLYCPWGLAETIPAMGTAHLLVAGPIEAALTAAGAAALPQVGQNHSSRSARGRLGWIGLGILAAATPVGLLASGTAFGEWSTDQVTALRGTVPAGMARLAGLWSAAPAPDYQPSGLTAVPGYLACALAGGAIVAALTGAAGLLLSRRARRTPALPAHCAATGIPAWMTTGNPAAPAPRRAHRFLERTLEHLAALTTEPQPRPAGHLRLAPGARLAIIAAALITIGLTRSPWALSLMAGATIAGAIGQKRGRRAAAILIPAATMAGLLSLPAAISTIRPGPVAISLWPGAGLTTAGLTSTWILTPRTTASIGVILALPVPLAELAELRLPRAVSMTLTLIARYLGSFTRLLANLLLARRARTITAPGLLADHAFLGATAVGLLTRSTTTAEAISAAMTARGYTGTPTPHTRTTPADPGAAAPPIEPPALETPMSPAPIISCHDLHHAWQHRYTSLGGITLDIHPGEQIGLLGANGSGKSTLMTLLDGLIEPTCGTYTAFGQPITATTLADPRTNAAFRTRIGYSFQDPEIALFNATVSDELAFGCHQLGLTGDQTRRRIADVLDLTGLAELADRNPVHLSGGQKRRLEIGTVLITNPQVLLLDEPTAALDPRTTTWLIDLLSDLAEHGRTLIIATHDLDLAATLTSRAIVIGEDHRIAADGPTPEILADTTLLETVNLIAPIRGRAVHAA